MKREKIVFLIYNETVYIKKNNKIDRIKIAKNIMKNGRINSINYLVSSLKKSKNVLSSFFKILSDEYTMIYFGNYNEYEINNIKNDFQNSGIEYIKLVDYKSLLNSKEDDIYIFFNNDYYYILSKNKKIILDKFDDVLRYSNSKIIVDQDTYNNFKKNLSKYRCYIIDNIVNYLFNLIC